MKKYIYSLFMCLSLVAFASCSDDTSEDPSKVTYYVSLKIQGDETALVPVGTTYTDAGVVAMEGTEDVTSKVTADSDVNTSKLGVYSVVYNVKNVDGFPSSTSRTVIVYDPTGTGDISGTYTVAAGSQRTNATGTVTPYSSYPVTIKKVAPGMYYVSDFMGGYYDKRAGYGANYAMVGYFAMNSNNTLDILSGDVAGWGDSMVGYSNASYNPSTGGIVWDITYASSMVFHVILTK